MPDKLSSPHRRNLAATCRRVEQSMIELEELIQEKGTPAITRQITRTYSAAQRAALLAAVHLRTNRKW
ncbi:MAG: hypothetical protein NTV54_13610 [Ignavibacteriales bacterium]|nr:hypothetical protein [Ignavibacteriales bacterium]